MPIKTAQGSETTVHVRLPVWTPTETLTTMSNPKDQARKPFNACTKAKIAAAVLSFIAVGLIIASFLIPPQGVVDSSVLAAVGEIFAFAALFAVWEAIDKGIDAKVVHGNTTITLDGGEPNPNL